MVIEVKIYPSYIYLDGVRVLNDEVTHTYEELYKPLNAKYHVGFVCGFASHSQVGTIRRLVDDWNQQQTPRPPTNT